MGPNGSGKSTLSYALMGHPNYEVTEGEVLLKGENILELEPDERAQRGLFLAFQYPTSIPGVHVANFLRMAANSVRGALAPNAGEDVQAARRSREFRKELREQDGRCCRSTSPSPAATSTRASPAARRSGPRSCRWRCSSRSSPSWTRPTAASTSTRCASSPRGSTRSFSAEHGRAGHHPLPAAAQLHQAAVRPHPVRRPDRRGRAAPSWPRNSREGLRRVRRVAPDER